MSKFQKAFTLVELIVVIVILSILATISFLSFSSYSSSTRDSVRLSDISNIAKGLVVQYSIGGSYIIPDNSINIYSGSTIIGYQGKVGSNNLNIIKLSTSNNNSGKDPLDNTYYTYNTNLSKTKYQITGFLENKGTVINRTSSINNIKDNGINNNSVIARNEAIYNNIDLNNFSLINQINATTYINRYPYTKGDSIGVILNYTGTTTGNNNTTTNTIYTPIEDNISTSTGIDISSGTLTSGKIVINNNTDSSTGVSVVSMSGYIVSTTSSSAGTCGSDNGQTVATTPTNLCTSGTPSSVLYNTGMGQYNWTCGSTSCKAYDNKTVLLLHFDGNLINAGTSTSTITNNNGVTLNSAGKFSNAAYFNGSNSYLTILDSTDWDFPGDVTIDFWINFNSISNNPIIFGQSANNVAEGADQYVYFDTSHNEIRWAALPSEWCTATTIATGQWKHLAFVKKNTTLYYFIDGVLQTSTTTSGINSGIVGDFLIGYGYNIGYLGGYLDEFRVSKGIARRTATFTKPTNPY